MSELKQWVSSTEVEVTESVTKVVNVDSLKSELARFQANIELSQKMVDDLTVQIAELEAVPNRPEEAVEVQPE